MPTRRNLVYQDRERLSEETPKILGDAIVRSYGNRNHKLTFERMPFALGDVLADNSNDSPIDILKHTAQGQMTMDTLPSTDLDSSDGAVELPSSGVRFYQTNLVTQTSNYQGQTGLTALRTYIFGQDGIFSIKLGANNDTTFGDGDWQNIKCNIVQNAAPTVADPEGLIPGWTSLTTRVTASK